MHEFAAKLRNPCISRALNTFHPSAQASYPPSTQRDETKTHTDETHHTHRVTARTDP